VQKGSVVLVWKRRDLMTNHVYANDHGKDIELQKAVSSSSWHKPMNLRCLRQPEPRTCSQTIKANSPEKAYPAAETQQNEVF